MTDYARAIAFSIGLTFATVPLCSVAFAQETATDPAAPAVDAPVDDGLSMGAAEALPSVPLTQETAEVNDTYLLKSIDAWQLRCVKAADGSDPCQLYQLLKDAEGNSVEIGRASCRERV